MKKETVRIHEGGCARITLLEKGQSIKDFTITHATANIGTVEVQDAVFTYHPPEGNIVSGRGLLHLAV